MTRKSLPPKDHALEPIKPLRLTHLHTPAVQHLCVDPQLTIATQSRADLERMPLQLIDAHCASVRSGAGRCRQVRRTGIHSGANVRGQELVVEQLHLGVVRQRLDIERVRIQNRGVCVCVVGGLGGIPGRADHTPHMRSKSNKSASSSSWTCCGLSRSQMRSNCRRLASSSANSCSKCKCTAVSVACAIRGPIPYVRLSMSSN